jgi:uncharacterized protein (DUF697 family)
MLETISTLLVTLVGVYAVAGVLVFVPFVLRGAGTVDPAARRGTLGFRALIAPGVIALWPMVLVRWWQASRGRR